MDLIERRKMRMTQAEQLIASSLTVAEWCRLNKVSESTMYCWLRRYREQEGGGGRKGWIEIDRKAAKDKVMLAVRDGGAGREGGRAPMPSGLREGGASAFPPIRASANGIGIEVPHGACESDVAAVMRAAMSL